MFEAKGILLLCGNNLHRSPNSLHVRSRSVISIPLSMSKVVSAPLLLYKALSVVVNGTVEFFCTTLIVKGSVGGSVGYGGQTLVLQPLSNNSSLTNPQAQVSIKGTAC